MPHPSQDSAYGIWSLNEVRDAVRGENWPTEVPIFWTISDISSASYDSKSYDTTTNLYGNPNSIRFSPDGLNFYITDTSQDYVGQFTMTTAWDVSTASETNTYDPAQITSSPQLVGFKNDGTKMFLLDSNGVVYQYSLATSWDISTVTYDSVSYNIETGGTETTTYEAVFSTDGTKLFAIGAVNDAVYTISLSTAWDLSTASYASETFSVASQDTTPTGLTFNPDGTQMFFIGSTNDSVYQYTLSTAFDVTTASYDSLAFSIASQETSPQSVTFSIDGTKMYILGSISDTVHQYSTGL